MSTSPVGKVNKHDWKRTAELALQYFVAYFAADLIENAVEVLSVVKIDGVGQVAVAGAILLLTELGKRLAQKPQA